MLEYKRYGTLHQDEWMNEIDEVGGGWLKGNAPYIGLQKRKYLTSAGFPIIAAFDGCALTGLRAKYRDRKSWASSQEMKVVVFFESRKSYFAKTMLALIVMVLEHQGLVDRI